MTEREFHQSRRMWAVVCGVTLTADRGDHRSHREWLTDLLGGRQVADYWSDIVRGYAFRGKLAAYRGDDFSRYVNLREVVRSLDRMAELGELVDTVGLGVRAGGVEQPWATIVDATAEEFRRHVMGEPKAAREDQDGHHDVPQL